MASHHPQQQHAANTSIRRTQPLLHHPPPAPVPHIHPPPQNVPAARQQGTWADAAERAKRLAAAWPEHYRAAKEAADSINKTTSWSPTTFEERLRHSKEDNIAAKDRADKQIANNYSVPRQKVYNEHAGDLRYRWSLLMSVGTQTAAVHLPKGTYETVVTIYYGFGGQHNQAKMQQILARLKTNIFKRPSSTPITNGQIRITAWFDAPKKTLRLDDGKVHGSEMTWEDLLKKSHPEFYQHFRTTTTPSGIECGIMHAIHLQSYDKHLEILKDTSRTPQREVLWRIWQTGSLSI